jgi:hypothetical protein
VRELPYCLTSFEEEISKLGREKRENMKEKWRGSIKEKVKLKW